MQGLARQVARGLGIMALLLSSSAHAVFEPNGLYALGGIGWGWIEGATLSSVTLQDSGVGVTLGNTQKFMFRFGLGTLFTDHIGLEYRYNQFSKVTSTIPFSELSTDVRLETTPYYMDLVGLLRIALSPEMSGFLTLGPGYAKVKRVYSIQSSVYEVTKAQDQKDITGFGVAGSIGLQYEFTPLWGIRLEAEGIKGSSSNNVKLGAITLNVAINVL